MQAGPMTQQSGATVLPGSMHTFVPGDVGVCAMFKLLRLAAERQLRAIQVFYPRAGGGGTWSRSETLIRVRVYCFVAVALAYWPVHCTQFAAYVALQASVGAHAGTHGRGQHAGLCTA